MHRNTINCALARGNEMAHSILCNCEAAKNSWNTCTFKTMDVVREISSNCHGTVTIYKDDKLSHEITQRRGFKERKIVEGFGRIEEIRAG